MKIIREGIVYSKLKSLCKQQWWILFSLVALNILVISSSFGIAYTVELLFKEQVTIKRLNYFVVIIWSLLLTFVLSNAIKQKLVFDLKEMLGNQLLSFAISRLLLKPQELFDKTSPTKLYSKVDYDIKAINVCLHFVLSILLQSSGILLFGFAYLLTTSIYMTILSVIIIPIIILIIFKISQNVAGANAKKREAASSLNSVITESLSGILSVKFHNMEGFLSKKISTRADDVYIASKKLHFFESIVSALITFGSFFSVIFVLWIGGLNVIDGTMTPGELIAFIMVLLLMSYSFASISDINTIYIKTINAVNNLNSLLRLDNFKDKIKPIEKSKLSNKIEIIDLSFTYQQSMLKSLSHISYTFITNNVYSIVGRSGSGKSTLTKLIAGLYCSYEGSLRISNQEVRTIQSRRDKIVTMVEQEPFFFSGTIWENITLEPNYSKVDEVKLNRSLKLSNFDSVMKSNDFTFYDNIESNISNLSGGEKQRLAIARALYADTPILLLDEATNSLDSATESNFYSNFNEIAKDKVVLIITHNLNNIYLADKVVVLDDGKIVASEAPNHIINNEHFKKVSEYTKQFKMEHLK